MWKDLTKGERVQVALGTVVALFGVVVALMPMDTISLKEKAPFMALVAGTLLAIIYMPVKPVEPKDIPRFVGKIFVALAGIASAWFWLDSASAGSPFQTLRLAGITFVLLSVLLALSGGMWLILWLALIWIKSALSKWIKSGWSKITIWFKSKKP